MSRVDVELDAPAPGAGGAGGAVSAGSAVSAGGEFAGFELRPTA